MREREILAHCAVGMNGKQVAKRLYISHGTVRTHVTNALARLGVPSRIAAVSLLLVRDESFRAAVARLLEPADPPGGEKHTEAPLVIAERDAPREGGLQPKRALRDRQVD
jgi:DNA-binding CsgD family transcriptional regulator